MNYHTIPLPKNLLSRLEEAGVTDVHLHFDGGHDEGNLNVVLFKDGKEYEEWRQHELSALVDDVTNWGYEAYGYNGAGEGVPYGDNYYYDLIRKRVLHEEWYHAPQSETIEMTFDELDGE